jgi:phosphate transport system permease protein
MTEISRKIGKKILQPVIEVFVGIPSVVYGWVGLSVLVPFIRMYFGGLGFSLLAAALVLSIMIFPTIASVAADALRAIPSEYREASFALGATRWQTIRKLIIPAATPGILTGVVLGLARAFGEALAVQMVIGNTVRIPHSLLDSTINLTSIITMDLGNTASGTAWNNALWSMAFLLLIISFVFILIVNRIGKKGSVGR